jgi:hypothetical protein
VRSADSKRVIAANEKRKEVAGGGGGGLKKPLTAEAAYQKAHLVLAPFWPLAHPHTMGFPTFLAGLLPRSQLPIEPQPHDIAAALCMWLAVSASRVLE